MKRFLFVLCLLLTSLLFGTSSTEKTIRVPYYIKCYKCKESYAKDKHSGTNPNTLAHRCIDREYQGHKPNADTVIYHCTSGHYLFVNYKIKERN